MNRSKKLIICFFATIQVKAISTITVPTAIKTFSDILAATVEYAADVVRNMWINGQERR